MKVRHKTLESIKNTPNVDLKTTNSSDIKFILGGNHIYAHRNRCGKIESIVFSTVRGSAYMYECTDGEYYYHTIYIEEFI